MSLHDTDALTIETATAAESLPDPTTVSGRMHVLANTGTTTAVWTASGPASPFTVDGVAAATLSILRGTLRVVQSDGTTWVVQPTATRRAVALSAVTAANGDAVFTFTPPFSVVPKVATALQTADTDATEVRVTALSTSSCTVNARQSQGVVVLGISVLGLPQALSGATVHLVAMEPGQGV